MPEYNTLSSDRRTELLTAIEATRTTLMDTAAESRFAYSKGLPPTILNHIEYVEKELAAMKAVVAGAKSEAEVENVGNRLGDLVNHVAYLMPVSEMAPEATYKLNEMAGWGIPQKAQALVRKSIDQLSSKNLSDSDSRALYELILDEYDYWDGYTDWYLDIRKKIVKYSLIMAIACLGIAIWLVLFGSRIRFGWIVGFCAAGISGASLSVLLRLPRMSEYGRVREMVFGVIARIASGAIAGMVGLGLLASGIINIAFTLDNAPRSIADIVANFGAAEASMPEGLLLLAIGILFGFTERLISRFEKTFFGRMKMADSAGPLQEASLELTPSEDEAKGETQIEQKSSGENEKRPGTGQ
jgi:hypothetical protein